MDVCILKDFNCKNPCQIITRLYLCIILNHRMKQVKSIFYFRKSALLFFSLIMLSPFCFSSFAKSEGNAGRFLFVKDAYNKVTAHHPVQSLKTFKVLTANPYVRNRRSVRKDENIYFFNLTEQTRLNSANPLNFILFSSQQWLHCFYTGLIPFRAPPFCC